MRRTLRTALAVLVTVTAAVPATALPAPSIVEAPIAIPAPPPADVSDALPYTLDELAGEVRRPDLAPWLASRTGGPDALTEAALELPSGGPIAQARSQLRLDGAAPPPRPETFRAELSDLWARSPRDASPADLDRAVDAYERLPPRTRAGLVQLVAGVDEATRLRDEALSDLDPAIRQAVVDGERVDPSRLDPEDLRTLHRGADVLLASLQASLPDLRAADDPVAPDSAKDRCGVTEGSLLFADPLCLVVVGSSDDTTYTGNHQLLVDIGGDNTFDNEAGTVEPLTAPFGAALAVSLGDEDVFKTDASGQGVGVLGIGVLYDGVGDDSYDGGSFAQGAGRLGVGILIDTSGRDRFEAVNRSQGFGNLGGIGMVVNQNLAGREATFVSGDWSQGSADLGGLGVLLGLQTGPDHYEAASRSQGYGHLSSVGLIVDQGGSDTYWAKLHAQGAASQGAVGLLYDLGFQGPGDGDLYNMSQHGQGHGLNAWGILVDVKGDSDYMPLSTHSRCCLQGVGHFGGLGVLLDGDGHDDYKAVQYSQGSYYLGTVYDVAQEPTSDPGINELYEDAAKLTALGGAGVLVDIEGNDDYWARDHSQGYATLRGSGTWIDAGGNQNSAEVEDDPDGDSSQGCSGKDARGVLVALGVHNDIAKLAGKNVVICEDEDGNPSGVGFQPHTIWACIYDNDCDG